MGAGDIEAVVVVVVAVVAGMAGVATGGVVRWILPNVWVRLLSRVPSSMVSSAYEGSFQFFSDARVDGWGAWVKAAKALGEVKLGASAGEGADGGRLCVAITLRFFFIPACIITMVLPTIGYLL